MKKLINFRAVPVFLLMLIVSISAGTFLHYAYGIAIIALAAAAFGAVIFVRRYRRYAARMLLALLALVVGFTSVWITLGLRGAVNSVIAADTEITGYVSSESCFDKDGSVNDIDNIILSDVKYVDGAGRTRKLFGYVALTNVSEIDFASMRVGSRIVAKGRLTQLGVNAADGSSVRMYRDAVNYFVQLDRVIENSGENTRFNLFDSIKTGVYGILNKYCGDSAGFMYAMIFGDKQGLNADEIEAFGSTGLAHLLAVSGLHVSMLALLLMWILKRLRCGEWVRFIVLTAVLILFNILCCFTPSVIRASIMILICFFGRFLGLKNDSISIMCFAACSILIFRPLYLFDLSFIMSFTAVFSLIAYSRPLARRFEYLPSAIGETASASIAVNAGMLPVMLHYFGTVSLVFMLANILILPIISVVYPIMLLLTCVGFIPYVGYLLVPIGYVFKGLTLIIGGLAALPFPSLNVGAEWAVIISCFMLMVLSSRFVMLDLRLKKAAAAVLTVVVCLACAVGNTAVIRTVTIETAYERPGFAAESGREGVYVLTSDKNRRYLIFNTEIDAYSLDGVIYYMRKRHIGGFEAVIKESIDEAELAALRNRYSDINMRSIYLAREGYSYRQYLNVNFYNHSPRDDITVDFYKSDEVAVECGGVSILFSADDRLSLNLNKEYDVIFAPYALADAANLRPRYIVNDYGYNNPAAISDCVPNNFTFKAINGNIKAWLKP